MSKDAGSMQDVFESMTLFLLGLCMDNFGEKDIGGIYNGQKLTLKVVDDTGEELQVVGGDSEELAQQLILACLHNLSIEHLGALHLRPLKSSMQVKS